MNKKKDNQRGSLLSSQEPHQKEEMDQATRASAGSFNLEVDKGISPDPDEYNKGKETGNIRQASSDNSDLADGASEIDPATDIPDLDAGEYDVTRQDLENLDGQDRDVEQAPQGS